MTSVSPSAAAARVAEPLADAGRQVRASVHHDAALPALALTHVIGDGDAARRLHDPAEAAAAVAGAELGQPDGQAAVRQRAVLRIVVAVHARGVVAGRTLVAPRHRRGRIVLAARAAGQLGLAGLRRPHQRHAEVPVSGRNLLRLRRRRRNPTVGRIEDQRGAPAGAFERPEHVVVGAGDVALTALLAAVVAAAQGGALPVECGALGIGEEFLVGIFGRALERRIGLDRPDALQIGLAPGCLQRRGSRRLCRGPRDGHRDDADRGHRESDRDHRA